jgi:hypothetical protein
MRFVPSAHVQFAPGDVIFRQSVRTPLVATLLLLLAAAGVFLAGITGRLPAVVAGLGGGSLLLFSAVSAVMLRRARSPANWLLACDGRRVLIKLRSYLNAAFPAEVPHVLEIPMAEVEAVRATQLELRGQDSARETLRERLLFLDIRLKPGVDLSELQERLRNERKLRSGGTAWRHYPVSVLEDRAIRIEWRSKRTRIVPGIDRALQLLGGAAHEEQGPPEYVELGGAGRRLEESTEAMHQVRALAEQGRIVEATLLAKRAFGWSTTEARQRIEQLAERPD